MERLRAERRSVLAAAIPVSAEVERMGAEREVLAAFAPQGRAAKAYAELWDEVQRRLSG
jgi:chromosome partitioning protein